MDKMKRSAFGWLDLLTGLLYVGLGISLLISPQWALSGMVFLLGLTAILSGLSEALLYARMRRDGDTSIALLITGAASALAGALILLNPVTGRWILNIAFPLWFIARCVARIVGFGLLRRITGLTIATVMLCLNALGLLLSIVLLFNQALFTMSLGILIGLDLILLGASNLIEAFSGVGATDVEIF